MSVRVHRSERCRHLIFRLPAGQVAPECLVDVLRQERVSCGWLRASGIVSEVRLRVVDTGGRPAEPRRFVGAFQVLALESSIGLLDGDPTISLRAVLAREGDRGLETLAGELLSARTVALEAFVVVFDDLALARVSDDAAGVSWLDSQGASDAVESTAAASTWASVASTTAAAPMPQRPGRPEVDFDAPVPEAGDFVDHFAFGRCEVLKSDGDRLHLRVHKGGRIREIALEMLRVTPLESDGARRHYKLERRI